MLQRESRSRKRARSLFSMDCKEPENDMQLCFLFLGPWWDPQSSLHSCVFIYKMGVMPSEQSRPFPTHRRIVRINEIVSTVFSFSGEKLFMTFQVLYRQISDLSFLCAVILVCHFYLSYKLQLMSWPHPMAISALNFPPMHLHDAGSPGPGTTKDGLPSDCKDGPGHRSQRHASGSRFG